MKLSIIIPVYNTQDYLAACLDSVIYDNLHDYEIIIVNDGSTDSSPVIASEYLNKYPNLIRVIMNKIITRRGSFVNHIYFYYIGKYNKSTLK